MAATAYPIPQGRGRWRLTLHNRQFAGTDYSTTMIADLSTSARSRQLVQAMDTPAQLSFTMDGRDPAAALVRELQTDVMAWRWDDQPGAVNYTPMGCDRPLFRGIVAQAEDIISEQDHTVNFVCHDYLSMLSRRIFSGPAVYTQVDQDDLVGQYIYMALYPSAANGLGFTPGSYLPLGQVNVNPDGTTRGKSGQLRDRNYTAGTDLFTTLDDLAKVAPLVTSAPGGTGAFDYDIIPSTLGSILFSYPNTPLYADRVRIFYPFQGVQRPELPLVYGATVSGVTRTITSTDYANYWRVIGSPPPNSADGTPPMFSEVWNADSNNVTVLPIGLWQQTDNAADVTIQSTLNEKAQGDLNVAGLVTPSYTLTLRPGAYRFGAPNMGDICPLIIQTGRLNVNTNARVLGITYDIGDDGQEDVSLVIGKPTRNLTQLFTQADRDADALTRR